MLMNTLKRKKHIIVHTRRTKAVSVAWNLFAALTNQAFLLA